MRLYILATDPLDHSRKIYSVSDFGFIQQQKIASEDGIGFRRQTFWITKLVRNTGLHTPCMRNPLYWRTFLFCYFSINKTKLPSPDIVAALNNQGQTRA